MRMLCPRRPQPVTIESYKTEKPFTIGIQWKIDEKITDDITHFNLFLNGKVHCKIERNALHLFKYEFTKLQADQVYQIYVTAYTEHKKLDDFAYQCAVESKPSNELSLKCEIPPKGAPTRIERMYPSGIDISWEPTVDTENIKVTVDCSNFSFCFHK